MIAFFPDLYPDELLYSAFSRYFDKSGYSIYRAAAEDIFQNSLTNPDVLFLNPIKDEIRSILTKQKSWEEIIERHTMYPHYARFLPQERRRKAFQSLIQMDFKHKDALQMPKNGKSDSCYLRYCPLCCQRDREIYGETYWHREHQMQDILVCPDHGCYLINSSILARGKKSPGLYSAECNVASNEIRMSNNLLERKLARYTADLFQKDVIDTNVRFHLFLHEKIAGSKYTSSRGEQKNVTLYFNDFVDYYSKHINNPISEIWQFQKIVDGKKYSSTEIAMVAMFIGISAEELATLEMPSELHQEAFDRKIREMHDKGIKYPQIAEMTGASYDYCKQIGEGRFGKYKKGRTMNNGGIRSTDWENIDKELLPKVKEAIAEIYNNQGRPIRVNFRSVAKKVGICEKNYPNLTLCSREIKENYEDWEHYWAREMVFFYQQLKKEWKPVTITAIMNMTNTKRQNLIRGVPYLENYTDAKTAEIIKTIVTC